MTFCVHLIPRATSDVSFPPGVVSGPGSGLWSGHRVRWLDLGRIFRRRSLGRSPRGRGAGLAGPRVAGCPLRAPSAPCCCPMRGLRLRFRGPRRLVARLEDKKATAWRRKLCTMSREQTQTPVIPAPSLSLGLDKCEFVRLPCQQN